MTSEQNLFMKLGRELLQTETSASVHCRREAARLPGTPVADVLLKVAQHAEESLAHLPAVIRYHPGLRIGHTFGRLLSALRQGVIDRLVDRERSYRGTLLGMHHGLDLVRLVLQFAIEQQQPELENWCRAWLETREALVERATRQLDWFAQHPREAIESGRRPLALDHD
jgi:hypothetical protein